MSTSLAGTVLAAGAGTRLAPLTRLRPKALCPVGDVPLVDLALERLGTVTTEAAVNVHHGREAMVEHLAGRAHLSIEEERPLGTAGALGALREWIDGRGTVVVNADAWCPGGLERLVAGWDGATHRLLLAGDGHFGGHALLAGALVPWSTTVALAPEPSGLYEVVWRAAAAEGRLEVVAHDGPFVDCGTPAAYLAANLAASGGATVVGEGAAVEGRAERCVLWPGTTVREGEVLSEAIRADDRVTVLVR